MSTKKRDGLDVLVLGGGGLGTALGSLVAGQGRRVSIWVRREELATEINKKHRNATYLPNVELAPELKATTDLAGALKETPLVIMAIPSQSFREVARAVGDTIEGDQIVVHATKGFEISTFKRMSQILREETCALKLGVLSGPTIAAEMVAGAPTGALVASPYDEVVSRCQELFKGSYTRVYGSRDVVGTEIAGAHRSVIGVAAGVVDGLGLGDNTKWLLISRGLSEMARLGVSMGGKVLTFGGLAGVGDLGATCASPLSADLILGRRLAKGEEMEAILDDLPNAAEAVPTADAIQRHASKLGLDLPITGAVYGLLHEGWTCQQALVRLMANPVGREVAALWSE